ADSVGREPVQVLESFEHALAREPVQRPKQKHVKPASTGVFEHGLKLGPVIRRTRLVVYKLAVDRPSLRGCKLAELAQLVFHFLPVFSGNPSVNRYPLCALRLHLVAYFRLGFAGLRLAENVVTGLLRGTGRSNE